MSELTGRDRYPLRKDAVERFHLRNMFNPIVFKSELGRTKGWQDTELGDLLPVRLFEDVDHPREALERLVLPESKHLFTFVDAMQQLEDKGTYVRVKGERKLYLKWYATALIDIKVVQNEIAKTGSVTLVKPMSTESWTMKGINISEDSAFPKEFPDKGELLLDIEWE